MSILVDANTTFLVQGITGREAVNLTRECLDYGSKIVGGVTPAGGGSTSGVKTSSMRTAKSRAIAKARGRLGS